MVVTLVFPWPRGLQVCGVSAPGHRSFRSAPRPSPDPGTASCAFCPAPSTLSLSEHGMLAANKVSNLLAVAFITWVGPWLGGGGELILLLGLSGPHRAEEAGPGQRSPQSRSLPRPQEVRPPPSPSLQLCCCRTGAQQAQAWVPFPLWAPRKRWGAPQGSQLPRLGWHWPRTGPPPPAPRVPASIHQGHQMGRSEARRRVSQPWPPQPLTGPGLRRFGGVSPLWGGLSRSSAGSRWAGSP